MDLSLNLSKKSFAIYGLGKTGRSIIKYFNKIGFKNYITWDDNKSLKRKWNLNERRKKRFKSLLSTVDYIVVSPGISLKSAKLKKILIKNKSKIITDLDLFYIFNPKIRSIVITGTNGKSTTCKILHHVLKKNGINVKLGGNIGRPVLTLNLSKKTLAIIEASSFQLAYSKFVRPDYALVLNIANDHLDWHGTMGNYVKSKLKIFSLQNRNNFAFINNKNLLKIYRKRKYLAKLNFVNSKKYLKIKTSIRNKYLNSKANDENMSFVYTLSKILKINKKSFVKSLNSFKGLSHRYETFFKKDNKIFINDSKATSFQACRFALASNDNILWIVGGMPKIGDKFNLIKLKKNILKSYIIGKYMKNFQKQIKGNVDFELSGTLKKAVISIFKKIKKLSHRKVTILLSPAAASYDQFKNFEERGDEFKKLVKYYARKYN